MGETFADSFFWALWYNGCEELVEHLACMLESTDHLFLESEQRESLCANDGEMQLLWMLLVMRFGDYGTSPRGGWVEHTASAAGFVRDQMRRTWLADEIV